MLAEQCDALEEAGFITGCRAIDRQKIGLGVLAFVRLDAERSNSNITRELESHPRHPEIIACHYISGTSTFELQSGQPGPGQLQRLRPRRAAELANVRTLHQLFAGRGA